MNKKVKSYPKGKHPNNPFYNGLASKTYWESIKAIKQRIKHD